MFSVLRKLVRDESGQDIIEYALLAAGIAVLLIPIVNTLGTSLSGVFGRISTQIGILP